MSFPPKEMVDQLIGVFHRQNLPNADRICADALNRAHEHVARRFWRDIIPSEPRPAAWMAAVFAVAMDEVNKMLALPLGLGTERNAHDQLDLIERQITQKRIPPWPTTNPQIFLKVWARAVRSVDPKTDAYVEPTIGQMIHFQTAARELGDCDPGFEHGTLCGQGRDAFEWFFGRSCKSDYTVAEVLKAWSRDDIHNARTRRRIVHSANPEDAYQFLKVCAAHGLMIRIEKTEDKVR